MSSLASGVLGLGLCACAGFAGAFAAVFGKLAGQEGLALPQQALFYVLLIAVSAAAPEADVQCCMSARA